MSEQEKEYRGFDLPTESYYFYDDKWVVDKKCKVSPKFDKLEELVDLFESTIKKLKQGEIEKKDALKISRQCTRDILELTLIGFTYEEMLKKHGYLGLDSIAMEMINLFLKIGGIDEMSLHMKRVEAMKTGLSGLEG